MRLALAALTFTIVLSCTSWAFASPAFLQCEVGPLNIEQSIDPNAPWEEDARDDGCDGLVVERSGQVPICLLEGASGVAERPVHEIDGTAVEAASGTCPELEAPDQVTDPSRQGPSEPPESAPDAYLPTVPVMAGHPVLWLHVPTERDLPSPPGHRLRVFRPPRS